MCYTRLQAKLTLTCIFPFKYPSSCVQHYIIQFQNRRQAERLARGRPPYNMMYANPFYPPPFGYPPYPGMPPSGSYPPTGMTGDPSIDILIPYGPRRPSLMPPALQGDSLMRGGLPPSHALSGSLASRQSANDIAAASYRGPGSMSLGLGDLGRRESSGSTMRIDDYGQPTTLAQDLAAMESNFPPAPALDQPSSRRSRNGQGQASSGVSRTSSSLPSHMQPFQSTSPEFTLPPPSSLNRLPGLPSLNASLDDPFQLPLPQPRMSLSKSRSTGFRSEKSSVSGPFDSSHTLAPPRSATSRSKPGSGKLPPLSHALEMHPELSPDPTSFRYPSGYTLAPLGSSFEGTLGGDLSASSGQSRGLRRRNSISKMNETNSTLSGSALAPSSSKLHMDTLPPLAPFDFSSSTASSFTRPLDPRRPPGSSEFAHPLMTSNTRPLRRMPSDASMHTSARRQSLRDSEMSRDAAFPPSSGRYGL